MTIIFWGLSFIATKIALRELAPAMILFVRLGLGSALLFSSLIFLGKFKIFPLREWGGFLLLGVIVFVHLMLQVVALQYTTAVNTGWLMAIIPVFIAILGRIFLAEKFTTNKILGIVIAATGALLLLTGGSFRNLGFTSTLGDGLILISCLTWAIYSVFGKRVLEKFPSLVTTANQMAVGWLLVTPLALSGKGFSPLFQLSSSGWIAVLYLGIFCSGIAYFLWFSALKDLEATKVGVYLYLEPLVTTLGAVIVLNEAFTPLTLFSGVLIIGGVHLTSKRAVSQ